MYTCINDMVAWLALKYSNNYYNYRVVGKFGKFGELTMIRQNKTIQISSYN